jgi:hypothetical protein
VKAALLLDGHQEQDAGHKNEGDNDAPDEKVWRQRAFLPDGRTAVRADGTVGIDRSTAVRAGHFCHIQGDYI